MKWYDGLLQRAFMLLNLYIRSLNLEVLNRFTFNGWLPIIKSCVEIIWLKEGK